MGNKKPNTPRSKIKNALRRLWMQSRERARALKRTGYCCADCGVKQSMAKGREVKLEVHHEPQIDWTGLTQLIAERILESPQTALCKSCHKQRHDKLQEKLPEEELFP